MWNNNRNLKGEKYYEIFAKKKILIYTNITSYIVMQKKFIKNIRMYLTKTAYTNYMNMELALQ